MITTGQSTPLIVLGILNLTPDSFSDGGQFNDPEIALNKAKQLLDDGSDFVDVGGESTRPGFGPVSESDEWNRLEPFLNLVIKENLAKKISVDTRKPKIMKRAADMNVAFINCVGPLPDSSSLTSLRSSNPDLSFITTHTMGSVEITHGVTADDKDSFKSVEDFFAESETALTRSGFQRSKIFFDPGLGFGKSDQANIALLFASRSFSVKRQIAIGLSRKGFVRRHFCQQGDDRRDKVSKLLELLAIQAGARLIRTHDVAGLLKLRRDFGEVNA